MDKKCGFGWNCPTPPSWSVVDVVVPHEPYTSHACQYHFDEFVNCDLEGDPLKAFENSYQLIPLPNMRPCKR